MNAQKTHELSRALVENGNDIRARVRPHAESRATR